MLGLQHVPVGVGQEHGKGEFNIDVKPQGYEYFKRGEPEAAAAASSPSTSSFSSMLDAQALLQEVYEQAKPHSLAVLVTTSLRDLAAFMKQRRDLFRLKTLRVVLMGGVDEASVAPRPSQLSNPAAHASAAASAGSGSAAAASAAAASEEGGSASAAAPLDAAQNSAASAALASASASAASASSSSSASASASFGGDFLLPDPTASNNQIDLPSAHFVYRECQELGVPLVVLTRVAAYAAPVPAFIFDELATIGHPVALRLRATQERTITDLWRRASLPPDDPKRAVWAPTKAGRG